MLAFLINPAGIAFNPASRKVYAVDTARNQVEIARAGEPGTQRVAVGVAPIALAIDARTNRIFVANEGDGTVSVIDGRGDQAVSLLRVGSRPYSIAVNAATGRVYLTHTFNDDLTVIDEATLAVRQVRPGSRDLIVIDEEANTVYLLGYEGPQMTVMDGVTGSFQLRPTGGHIWGAAMDRQGTLYIARIGSNELAIIARGAKSPSTLPTGEMPCAVALDEDAVEHSGRVDVGDERPFAEREFSALIALERLADAAVVDRRRRRAAKLGCLDEFDRVDD